MRLRGRRHWNASISIGIITETIDPANPSGDKVKTLTLDPARSDMRAAVQSLDDRAINQAGLRTGREWYWVRTTPDASPIDVTSNRIIINNRVLRLDSVNPGAAIPGDDVQFNAWRDPSEQSLL